MPKLIWKGHDRFALADKVGESSWIHKAINHDIILGSVNKIEAADQPCNIYNIDDHDEPNESRNLNTDSVIR